MNSSASAMGGFASWAGIATYPGATAATLLITRVLHQVVPDRLEAVPEVAVAYAVALALLVFATLALSSTPRALDLVLCLINATGVAVTCVGGNTLFGLTSPTARTERVTAAPVSRNTPQPEEPTP